jgi:hypothetical protein
VEEKGVAEAGLAAAAVLAADHDLVVEEIVDHEPCLKQHVLNAASRVKCHFVQAAADLSIVVNILKDIRAKAGTQDTVTAEVLNDHDMETAELHQQAAIIARIQ